MNPGFDFIRFPIFKMGLLEMSERAVSTSSVPDVRKSNELLTAPIQNYTYRNMDVIVGAT